MKNKSSILVLCGGQSTEHDISLLSAQNVTNRLDPNKYDVSIAKIEQDGSWLYFKNPQDCFSHTNAHLMHITPGQKNPFSANNQPIHVGCIFPVLHGTNGEDGVVQGVLESLQLPYVGADVLGSAVGMDKDLSKRLMRDAGILVVDWQLVRHCDRHKINFADMVKQFGLPMFIKPNSLGSSVGTEKVKGEKSFNAALDDAFRFDEYVLIERGIDGREIECSVLGGDHPKASAVGEIILHAEFYSYAAKYLDDDAATVTTPAHLSPQITAQVQTIAVKAFQALRCFGMARVDFFLSPDEKIYVNEINTIPGFTNISMYPKNWEASGLSHEALLDELIQIAMDRFAYKKSLVRVFRPAGVGVGEHIDK